MIIEQSDLPAIVPEKKRSYLLPLVVGTFVTLTVTTLPVLFVVLKNDKPTGTLLSPIPQGVVSENTTEPTSGVKPSYSQMVNLAQNYLNKAYDLSRNPNQTDSDKQAILASLNQSLKQATDTINTAPTNPLGYMVRAQVLTAISKINPKAATLAKQDLDIADKLNTNKNFVLPSPVNPVNLLKDEQAAASTSSVTIAAPNEAASPSAANTSSGANANQKSFILPANRTEFEIKDPLVKSDSYIYLIPNESTNQLVSLKTKSTGSFTVSTDTPESTDVTIQYYVINE